MKTIKLTLLALVAMSLVACGGKSQESSASGEAGDSGAASVVKIDGSSTVFPITEAVAEEYRTVSKAQVTIGVSGTGGGFKKFCAGELAITGASRYIKPTEKELCGKAGIEYIELPVAYDGVSVVVNTKNDWVDHLTTAELKKIWEPAAQKTVTNWNQVRAGFPDQKLTLFGPGVDSGTFDYFTKKINGKAQSSRGDYTASEDDNVLVHGVSTDKGALGYFGFAYYAENKGKLKAAPVKHGDKAAVSPTLKTIGDGTYAPLSRPIFIYISKKAAERKEVTDFINFWMKEGGALAQEVGYIPLPADVAKGAVERFESRTVGSVK